jgi:hypothetical protein
MPNGPNSSNCVEIGSVDFAVGRPTENLRRKLRRKDTNTIIQQIEKFIISVATQPQVKLFWGLKALAICSPTGHKSDSGLY